MAVTVIGGLTVATLLTLVVIPVVYYLVALITPGPKPVVVAQPAPASAASRSLFNERPGQHQGERPGQLQRLLLRSGRAPGHAAGAVRGHARDRPDLILAHPVAADARRHRRAGYVGQRVPPGGQRSGERREGRAAGRGADAHALRHRAHRLELE